MPPGDTGGGRRYIGRNRAARPTIPQQWSDTMSIVRVGMSETKSYGDGYDAIFGKGGAAKKPTAAAKKPAAKKAPAKKKAAKKK